MNIIYLTYGTQSGVAIKLSKELSKYNFTCKYINIANNLNFRYEKVKFPRLTISNVINCFISYKIYGQNWKSCYLRTDYAYNWMSRNADDVIKNNENYDLILQSGLLFSPENLNNKPYILGILDNTYLIGKLGRNRPPTSLILSDYFVKKETEAYQRANLILVMSNHVRQSLIEDYGIPSKNIFVTGAGPNIEPDDDYVPSSHKYESLKIVMIAMDFYRKGGLEVLEAFKRLKKRMPTVCLVVIGEKVDLEIDGVSFMGVQDKLTIKKELSEANLYVMPSHAEPFGIAFIEAMAFHTPCIGSRVEAIPEIISDGKTGFLVTAKDVEGLAKRMEDVLKDSSLAKSMGAAGHIKYKEKFTWSKVGKAINDQLSRLADR